MSSEYILVRDTLFDFVWRMYLLDSFILDSRTMVHAVVEKLSIRSHERLQYDITSVVQVQALTKKNKSFSAVA